MWMMGRKGALALVLGLGTAYVAGSWWMGRQLEHCYADERSRLLARLGIGPRQMIAHRYVRGVFSSTVRDVLVLHLPMLPAVTGRQGARDGHVPQPPGAPHASLAPDSTLAPAQAGTARAPAALPRDKGARLPVYVHLRQDIRHGPLPGWRWGAAAIEVSVERVEGLDSRWQKALDRASTPRLAAVIGFDGSGYGAFRWPDGEFTLPGPAGLQLSWKTLAYDYRIDAARQRGQGSLRWPQFRMRINPADRRQPATHVEIVGWQFEHQGGLGGEQWLMPPGRLQGRVERLAVRAAGPGRAPETNFLTWEQAETRLSTFQQGAQLQMEASVRGRGMLGGVAFDEMWTENRLSGVDAQVLRETQPLLMKALMLRLAGQARLMARTDMQAAINRLLAMRPVYQDRLRARRDGRQGSLETEVRVQDASPLRSSTGLNAQLAARTRTDIAARLPRAWATALAQAARLPSVDGSTLAELADGLVARQVLRSDGEHWLLDARIQASQLLFNGRPLSSLLPAR